MALSDQRRHAAVDGVALDSEDGVVFWHREAFANVRCHSIGH